MLDSELKRVRLSGRRVVKSGTAELCAVVGLCAMCVAPCSADETAAAQAATVLSQVRQALSPTGQIESVQRLSLSGEARFQDGTRGRFAMSCAAESVCGGRGPCRSPNVAVVVGPRFDTRIEVVGNIDARSSAGLVFLTAERSRTFLVSRRMAPRTTP